MFGTGENLGAAQCALRLVYQVQDKVNNLKDKKNLPLIKSYGSSILLSYELLSKVRRLNNVLYTIHMEYVDCCRYPEDYARVVGVQCTYCGADTEETLHS